MHNAKSIDTTHTNRTVQHKKKWFYTLFGHYLPFGPPLLTACAWHKQWQYKGTKKNPFQQHFRSPFQGFFPDKPCRGKTRSPPSRLGLKVKRLKVKSKAHCHCQIAMWREGHTSSYAKRHPEHTLPVILNLFQDLTEDKEPQTLTADRCWNKFSMTIGGGGHQ